MRVVVALGGNALLRRGESLDADHLQENIGTAADAVADIARNHDVIVTHGNGPQVGLLSLQNEAYASVAPYPLDVLGAESDGMIGYLVERELRSRLPNREIATLLTLVTVDPDDPAFRTPTKPIGPVYEDADAHRFAKERGWQILPDGDGFRRVVPSPKPRAILELHAIRTLLEAGVLVICAGGGGIPVSGTGAPHGLEAVIDKDRTAALLAPSLEADRLLLLTDVDGVYMDWGSDSVALILLASPRLLTEMKFDPGSMGPKVEAACSFVAETDGEAVIGRLTDASRILEGVAGTHIKR